MEVLTLVGPLASHGSTPVGQKHMGAGSERLQTMKQGNNCKISMGYLNEEGYTVGEVGAWKVYQGANMVGL